MTQRAHFTVGSAARIAKVVRAVENARPSASPLTSRRVLEVGRRAFRVGSFSGAWGKGASKTVAVAGGTLSALNLFAAIGTAAGNRNCAIARDGTAWYLIAAEC